jgi:hypothetical protein
MTLLNSELFEELVFLQLFYTVKFVDFTSA